MNKLIPSEKLEALPSIEMEAQGHKFKIVLAHDIRALIDAEPESVDQIEVAPIVIAYNQAQETIRIQQATIDRLTSERDRLLDASKALLHIINQSVPTSEIEHREHKLKALIAEIEANNE